MSQTGRDVLNNYVVREKKRDVLSGVDSSIIEVNKILNEGSSYDKAVLRLFGSSQLSQARIEGIIEKDNWNFIQIKKLCFTYGLRFVPVSMLKSSLPVETFDKVRVYLKRKEKPNAYCNAIHEHKKRLFVIAPIEHLHQHSKEDPIIVYETTGNSNRDLQSFEYVAHYGKDLTVGRAIKSFFFKDGLLSIALITTTFFWFVNTFFLRPVEGFMLNLFVVTPLSIIYGITLVLFLMIIFSSLGRNLESFDEKWQTNNT